MTYFLELVTCLKKELVTGKSYAQKNVTSYRYEVTSRLLSKKESVSFYCLCLRGRTRSCQECADFDLKTNVMILLTENFD